MKETGFSRWTCDHPECTMAKFSVLNTPIGWVRDDASRIFCGQSCLEACQTPWHADLCVEPTLADVVKKEGSLQLAVNAASHGPDGEIVDFYTHRAPLTDSSWRHIKSRHLVAVHNVSGIATNENGEESPHSIVRLVCPTFADACEHPNEFAEMRKAAISLHKHLSDQAEWSAIAKRMSALTLAIQSMYTLADMRPVG